MQMKFQSKSKAFNPPPQLSTEEAHLAAIVGYELEIYMHAK